MVQLMAFELLLLILLKTKKMMMMNMLMMTTMMNYDCLQLGRPMKKFELVKVIK